MATKNNKRTETEIDWPKSHFTIDDIQNKYKEIVNITLRFRVKRAMEKKEIVVIGKIKPAIGRPKIVFARVNPSKELLEAAKTAGVIFTEDNKAAAITVAEVKTEKKQKTVVPVVTPKDSTVTTVESSSTDSAVS